jgi:hypothetical protein
VTTLRTFLEDGPKFLAFDSGRVEMRLDSDPKEPGAIVLRDCATGLFVTVIITDGDSPPPPAL